MLEALAQALEHDRAANLALARSVPEDICGSLPGGLAQSPCWIICHLCLADTLQHESLTAEVPELDQPFFAEFGPNSEIANAPALMRQRFGSWSGAIEAAAESHRKLTHAVRHIDPHRLHMPHPSERVRSWLPTLADNIAYAVWHEGNHGGQLRAWIHAARHSGLLAEG